MATFDFRDKFDAAPLGAFTPTTAWPIGGPINSVPTLAQPMTVQQLYSIVAEPLARNGRACRILYPANKFGTQGYYQVKVLGPSQVANIEFKWRFEPGFQLNPTVNSDGGKVGPCIQWGNITVGCRCMFWWSSHASNNAHPVFTATVQNQTTGAEVTPGGIFSAPIVIGQVYKFRIQAQGGPSGWAKFWIDDVLFLDYEGNMPNTTTADSHYYDFNAFAGGGSINSAPTVDCYGTHWDVHIWSGVGVAPPPQMNITQAQFSLA